MKKAKPLTSPNGKAADFTIMVSGWWMLMWSHICSINRRPPCPCQSSLGASISPAMALVEHHLMFGQPSQSAVQARLHRDVMMVFPWCWGWNSSKSLPNALSVALLHESRLAMHTGSCSALREEGCSVHAWPRPFRHRHRPATAAVRRMLSISTPVPPQPPAQW